MAVVIGARVMSLAGEGELLVTSTTKELVTGSGFGFEDLSAHELKGVPGSWQVFAVTSLDDEPRALVALLALALLLYLTAWLAEGPVSKEVVEGTPETATGAP